MLATILVVEDHGAVRRSLRDWLLVEFPRCRVIEAASGEEAIAMAQTESPDVVIMDNSLPATNGIEATRQIKATVPAARIVVLTIHENDTYRADAAAAGADAYVPKRVMQTDLIPTLATLLVAHDD
jgi:DNA-binding NarL/FixJ family response regulator